jgi:hypothetical protein
MMELAKEVFGKPQAIVQKTRRMSYLHPKDGVLTAMDDLRESRRVQTLQQQQEVILRSVDRVRKQEERWARLEAQRQDVIARRAVQDRECMDKELQWKLRRKMEKERLFQERMTKQVRVCVVRAARTR